MNLCATCGKAVILSLLVVTVVLQIVSLRTNHWAKSSKGFYPVHVGLWEWCLEIEESVNYHEYIGYSDGSFQNPLRPQAIRSSASRYSALEPGCTDLPSSEENGKLKAARGMIIATTVGSLLSGTLVFVTIFRSSRPMLLIASFLFISQAFGQAGGVGVAVWWLDRYYHFFPSYDWSILLGAVSAGLYLITSVLGCVFAAVENREDRTRLAADGGTVSVRYAQMVAVAEA